MSLTKNKKLCANLYRKFLLRVRNKLGKKGYLPRSEERRVGEEDFVLFESEKFDEKLKDIWTGEDLTELTAFVPDFVYLSERIEKHSASNNDTPPFIYVMY